jgi:hypothetical protein
MIWSLVPLMPLTPDANITRFKIASKAEAPKPLVGSWNCEGHGSQKVIQGVWALGVPS